MQELLPQRASDLTVQRTERILSAANKVDRQAAEVGRTDRLQVPEQILIAEHRLAEAKGQVDAMLNGVLELRVQFAAMAPGPKRRSLLRQYLRVTVKLIDLCGRVHYQLADTIHYAAYRFASRPQLREQLIYQLMADRSRVGAAVMSWALLDPPPNSPNRAQPASPATKTRLLSMIAASRRLDVLPVIAQFLKSGRGTPALLIAATETVRTLGLPQDPRPVPTRDLPPPEITADELHRILASIDATTLSDALKSRRSNLLRWLRQRQKRGLLADSYQLGPYEFQPGDWLLMRNPSPFNLFTDLAPGLFTHVGVVTMEHGPDGIRRMVVVDVTERGTHVPANNLDSILKLPLYFALLRHEDPAMGNKMAEVAASLIGNEMQFDLSFDTQRVTALRGQPLARRKINTYCAGLLLLCAQEAGAPLEHLFPVWETPAGGRTVENLHRMELRVGNQLVSPTGPLFAPRMRLVGHSDPIYDPGRAIEQRIYDYFAASLKQKDLIPTPNLFQLLRQKLAEAAKDSPLLGQALATAAGIHADTDLVAAARAAAVVDTLDEIAYGSSAEFRYAVQASRSPPPEQLPASGRPANELQRLKLFQKRHAELLERARRRQISPRQVNDALMRYYINQGMQQIDQRFFPLEPANRPKP